MTSNAGVQAHTKTTRDESPGGAGLTSDAAGGFTINRARFSFPPTIEASASTWSTVRSWEVFREPAGHRVVVCQRDERRWQVHNMMVAGICVLVMCICLVMGMPFVYGLPIAIVAGLVGWGVVLAERFFAGSMILDEDYIEVDAPVWEATRADIEALCSSVSGHELLVKTERKFGDDSIIGFEHRLRDVYESDPSAAAALGRGVRDCDCLACRVCKETGTQPVESGVVVSQRGRQRTASLTPVVDTAAVRKNVERSLKSAQRRTERERRKEEVRARKEAAAEAKKIKLETSRRVKQLRADHGKNKG